MILPIVAYGDPVLKKKATEITSDYADLKSPLPICMKPCTALMV